jgi:secreted trypsin-like serine protease
MKSIILFVLLTSPLAHASKRSNFILGGQEVNSSDPVQASTVGVYSPSPGGQGGALCTGTLISKDIALTAAHCIQPGGQKPVLIFGRDLHSASAQYRDGTAVAVDPKWRTHQGRGMDQGDVALVKFGGGMPAGYHQVPTVHSASEIKTGGVVELAGYGVNNARTHAGAGKLRKTNVQIVDGRPGKTEMIMDQTHGSGACHGDSGGPAFVRNGAGIALAGLTNRGYPDSAPDDCAHQVVYTKVPYYKKWIAASEKKLEASRVPANLSKRVRKPRARVDQAARHRARKMQRKGR